MPGRWTPEHRAAYEATLQARREAQARGEPWVKPRRVKPSRAERRRRAEASVPVSRHQQYGHPGLELTCPQCIGDVVAATRQVVTEPTVDMAPLLARLAQLDEAMAATRATALRTEDKAALTYTAVQAPRGPAAASQRDEQMLAAVRSLAASVRALEATVEEREKRDTEVLRLLRRIDSRPARTIEFRPDHRRHHEGGEPVRVQRRRVGLGKRGREL